MGLLNSLLQGATQPGQQGGGNSLTGEMLGAAETLAPMVISMLASRPGPQGSLPQGGSPISGLIKQFEQAGIGHIAQSWSDPDAPNVPVSPDQLHSVLGANQVDALSTQTGMPRESILGSLAAVLPGIVAKMAQGHAASTAQPSAEPSYSETQQTLQEI